MTRALPLTNVKLLNRSFIYTACFKLSNLQRRQSEKLNKNLSISLNISNVTTIIILTQVRRHFLNQMENYNTFCPTRTCDFQFWDYATANVFSKIVGIVFLDRNYYVRVNWKSKLCFKYVLYFYVKISRQWLLFAIFSNVELMWFNKKKSIFILSLTLKFELTSSNFSWAWIFT